MRPINELIKSRVRATAAVALAALALVAASGWCIIGTAGNVPERGEKGISRQV